MSIAWGDCSPNAHEGIKLYGSVTVGSKGQIVIPSEVRKVLNINPGDSVCVVTKHNIAVGLIKMSDLEVFMEYLRDEMDTVKRMALESTDTPLSPIVPITQ